MRKLLTTACIALAAFANAQDFGPRPAKPANITNYLTGDSADAANHAVNGPAILLMGGSSEVDAAFSQKAYPIINGGDILVLRTDNSSGYQTYLYNLVSGPLKPNSVETIVVDTTAKADTDYVEWACLTAEMIWFAGGNQSTYLSAWRGTRLQTAVQDAYDRGIVVGGTSAGMAIMSEFIFSPGGASAPTGAQAIANPYRAGNNPVDAFLNSSLMEDTITDTHFFERDRMGRPLSWMARLRKDNRTSRIIAIAADERASIFIDKNRMGSVLCGTSTRAVYIMWEDDLTQRVQVVSGQPLIYNDVLRAKLKTGATWNFNTMTGSRNPIRLSVSGGAATPYNPTDPYTDAEGPPWPPPSSGIPDCFMLY